MNSESKDKVADDGIKLRYAKIESMEDVRAAVAKGVESANTMKQRVQYAAIACMIGSTFDAEESVEIVNGLVNDLGKGVKAEGLVKFLVHLGGFRLNAEGTAFESVKSAQWIHDNLESAKATPWWSFAPATPYKGFELNEELRKLIARSEKALATAAKDEAKAAKIDVDGDMIKVLKALIGGNPVDADGAVKLITRITPRKAA